jgi:ABC-2 type transport system ATP-binding protein
MIDVQHRPHEATVSKATEPAVEVRNASLWRRTQEEFSYDLKRLIFDAIRGRGRGAPHRRRVLHDITLTIGRGEKVGIVGGNGSGKSTLLKVIAGILKPTSGEVHVHGAIAPLIELGGGFDAELSLIENIIYYGVLLGRDREEMRSRVEPILDFAELTDHAHEPLKTLSSGMGARLSFAIATDVRPEILILDEVLAVGDEAFQRKSSMRIARFWDAHSTIIVVSHDPTFIQQQCERAVLLEAGRIIAMGETAEVIARYHERMEEGRALVDLEMIERLNHSVVRGDGSSLGEQRLFLVRDGKKHWIAQPDWLAENGLHWPNDVKFLDRGVVERIPTGNAVATIRGAVDAPAPGSSLNAWEFEVAGWAYVPEGWHAIEVWVANQQIGSTRDKHDRVDVAQFLGDESLASGFSVHCVIPPAFRELDAVDMRVEILNGNAERTVLAESAYRLAVPR